MTANSCHSPAMPASADMAASVRHLLAWYDEHRRSLPWRAPPGRDPDAYKVLLSEVMLQQTTVATVKPRFAFFLAHWPTVEQLAAAEEADVMRAWAGLGYYARARRLHACAKAIAGRGGFPTTAAGLAALPGLGAYTSAAIAAIVFGEPVAAVDTNVERVIARLFGIDRPVAEARTAIRGHADAIVPADRPGDFAQALMDLGATVCRPKRPRCGECPLRRDCAAFASGDPERFPAPKTKRERPHRHGLAWWHEREGAVWLVRRAPEGLLGGMAALPGPDWEDDQIAAPATLANVRHIFTHFSLDLSVAKAEGPPPNQGWWQPLDRIGEAGLPSLYAKAVAAVLAKREEQA